MYRTSDHILPVYWPFASDSPGSELSTMIQILSKLVHDSANGKKESLDICYNYTFAPDYFQKQRAECSRRGFTEMASVWLGRVVWLGRLVQATNFLRILFRPIGILGTVGSWTARIAPAFILRRG